MIIDNPFFNFQKKHSKFILFIIAVITIFFAFQATKMKLNADFSILFGQVDSPVYTGGEGSFDRQQVEDILSLYPSLQTTDTLSIAEQPIPSSLDENADVPYPSQVTGGTEESGSGTLLLLIKSENFFTPVFLNTLDICLDNLVAQGDVKEYSSVFDYVTITKKGTRLSLSPFSTHKKGTAWTDSEVTSLKELLAKDPTATGYLVSNDLQSVIFHVRTTDLSEERIYGLLDYFEPLEQYGASFAITGATPITYRIMYYLSHDLTLLLGLCLLVILVTFYLSFRAKRSMFLPFILSIVGMIWTFGTMALLGYEITLINIVTPCMVLVLGSSYSVHLLSVYYRIHSEGEKNEGVSFYAAEHINKTILLAALTTVIGFLSLLVSKVAGLREFGLSVSIGIVYCAFLSLTFLPCALSFLSSPKAKQEEVFERGVLTRGIKKLSSVVTEKWWVFCLLFVLVGIGFVATKDKVNVDTNYMAYFPSSDRIGSDTRLISKELGGDMPYDIVIKAPTDSTNFFLDPTNLAQVYSFEEELMQSPDILQNISFSSYVAFLNETYTGTVAIPANKAMINLFSRLVVLLKKNGAGLVGKVISSDNNEIHIYLQSYDSIAGDVATVASSERVESLVLASLPLLSEGVSVQLNGTNAQALRFSRQLLHDQNVSQIVAYLLVFLLAAFAFRSLIRGVLTLIPVATAVAANYIVMYFLNIPFDMVTVSFASVAIGAGVDDAIHFLLHYSQNKKKNPSVAVPVLVRQTLEETGRAIVITTLSIVLGMLMLSFGSYTPIRYFGILMSVALMNSMLATILILPAMIVGLEKLKKVCKR